MPTYNGTTGADIFTAPTAESWTIFGNGGSDTLTGGAGNDFIYGGAASDTLKGGAGNDIFFVGPSAFEGIDTYDGGSGVDSIVATGDGATIGISAIKGVETIDAGGFGDVKIKAGPAGVLFDFSKMTLIDIAEIGGGAGNDRITGTEGDDVINGFGGQDVLNGGGGDDFFNVGTAAGFARFNGGTGFNTIQAVAENAVIRIQAQTNIQEITSNGFGNVTISGAGDSDLLDFTGVTLTDITAINGGMGNDTIIGSDDDNVINGGDGSDRLSGGIGFDTIDGGGGNNVLNGGSDDDVFLVGTKTSLNTYIGGSGFDTIQGNGDEAVIVLTTGSLSGIESIVSGGFGVTIAGTTGVDVIDLRSVDIPDGEIALIDGKDGNDTIYGTNANVNSGSTGADTIAGGTGDDRIFGGSGDDIIEGGADFDYLDGGAGFDTVNGNLGDDMIVASGLDFLFGDEGNDTFLAKGGAANNFDGGADFDTILATANGNIAIETIVDVERIDGGGFTNVNLTGLTTGGVLDFTGVELIGIKSILGSGQSDDFIGSDDNDLILGGGGADLLNGGAGNDTISGGSAFDELSGGEGADIFKDTIANVTGDTINDFGTGDKIQISNLAYSSAVTLAFDTVANTLSIDPDGAGAKKAFAITVLGDLSLANFAAVSDGATGTFIEYVSSETTSSGTQLGFSSDKTAFHSQDYFIA